MKDSFAKAFTSFKFFEALQAHEECHESEQVIIQESSVQTRAG